ncbi:MAG: hypothetical protein BMS9Abin07_0632 [Acidimicrobiia bacterium]|nr:MAG: hypothetical protein BMS9Abin07_0632 [Acidimicrobiia bacterium]
MRLRAGQVVALMAVLVAACGPTTTSTTDSSQSTPEGLPAAAATGSDRPEFSFAAIPFDSAIFGGRTHVESAPMIWSVTAGGPGLVAVGRDGRSAVVWTSTDGISWYRVPHDEAVFGGDEGLDSFEMTDVTVGGPGLVAVGKVRNNHWGGVVWTSRDGFLWSRVPFDEAVFGGVDIRGLSSVTAGGPGLVAIGTEQIGVQIHPVIWTSPDGINWSRAPLDTGSLAEDGVQRIFDVTTGGPGLVAVGSDGTWNDAESAAAVWTSPDGLTWSRVPHDEGVFGGEGGQVMRSVTVGGPGFVAVGVDHAEDLDPFEQHTSEAHGAVWTSPDGISWSRVADQEALSESGNGPRDMWSVTAGGPGLVAVGTSGTEFNAVATTWSSSDGLKWSLSDDQGGPDSSIDHSMLGVANGPRGVVAVGFRSRQGSWGAAVWIEASASTVAAIEAMPTTTTTTTEPPTTTAAPTTTTSIVLAGDTPLLVGLGVLTGVELELYPTDGRAGTIEGERIALLTDQSNPGRFAVGPGIYDVRMSHKGVTVILDNYECDDETCFKPDWRETVWGPIDSLDIALLIIGGVENMHDLTPYLGGIWVDSDQDVLYVSVTGDLTERKDLLRITGLDIDSPHIEVVSANYTLVELEAAKEAMFDDITALAEEFAVVNIRIDVAWNVIVVITTDTNTAPLEDYLAESFLTDSFTVDGGAAQSG